MFVLNKLSESESEYFVYMDFDLPGPYNLLLHAGVRDSDFFGIRAPVAGKD